MAALFLTASESSSGERVGSLSLGSKEGGKERGALRDDVSTSHPRLSRLGEEFQSESVRAKSHLIAIESGSQRENPKK